MPSSVRAQNEKKNQTQRNLTIEIFKIVKRKRCGNDVIDKKKVQNLVKKFKQSAFPLYISANLAISQTKRTTYARLVNGFSFIKCIDFYRSQN